MYRNKYVNIAKLASIKLYIMQTIVNSISARLDLVVSACEDLGLRVAALEQRPLCETCNPLCGTPLQ